MNVLNQMKSDVVVGLDEVVNVFVSNYEDQLFDRKDLVSQKLKDVKRNIENICSEVVDIDVKELEWVKSDIGLECKVKTVSVDWNTKNEVGTVLVKMRIVNTKDSGGNTYDSINKVKEIKISKSVCKQYFQLKEEQECVEFELIDVMNLIKGINRKERKIRSKISEMKLIESGFGELLENDDVLKLVMLE